MKIKKEVYLYFVFISFSFILIPSVFAQTGVNPSDFTQQVIDGVKGVFSPVFSALFGIYQSDDFLFAKILLFILLFIVVRIGIKATPALGEQKGLVNIIALVVSLFAIRYISDNDLTRGILLPYGTLGVALVTLVPFLIYFFFVEKTMASSVGRKIAWFIFVLVFAFLWFTRSRVAGGLSQTANYLYLSIIALGILLFLFDRHVKRYFDLKSDYKHTKNALEKRIALLQADYEKISNVESDAAKNQRKHLLKQIKEAENEMHGL